MEQFYLYIAIILSAIIIMMLSIAVVYYRRKLNKCKTALVRCINENIEMREKLPEYELPHLSAGTTSHLKNLPTSYTTY